MPFMEIELNKMERKAVAKIAIKLFNCAERKNFAVANKREFMRRLKDFAAATFPEMIAEIEVLSESFNNMNIEDEGYDE
jgi:hypothetical protein